MSPKYKIGFPQWLPSIFVYNITQKNPKNIWLNYLSTHYLFILLVVSQ